MATLNAWYPPGSAQANAITANQGSPNTDANAWPVRITDGTHDATVTAGGALNVNISGGLSNPLPVTDAAAEASLASIDTKTPTVGQKTMAASSPVVIASDQSIIPVHDAALSNKTAASLVPEAFDYISLSYTGDNLTTAVYKTGGSGGSTVATLTLAYTGAQLDSVTKS